MIARSASVPEDTPTACLAERYSANSFSSYLGSIASTDIQVVILEGYSHVDVLTAQDNETVPPIVDWVNHVLQQKLLGGP